MQGLLGRFSRDDRGATAVEYGLICALIALAIITAVALIGTRSSEMYDRISTTLENAQKA